MVILNNSAVNDSTGDIGKALMFMLNLKLVIGCSVMATRLMVMRVLTMIVIQ
jgi:hypothetical protein